MSDVNISINKDLIKPIIEAKINTAIVEALEGRESIIEDVVTKMLNEKVDERGEKSRYSSSIPFIQWLCENAIRDAAKQAVKNYISSSNETLINIIQEILKTNTKSIAASLINSFINATKSDWTMKVDLIINRNNH